MAKRNDKIVLFLCTGNYYRSRFSEILFNSVARKLGLKWRAISRGLALERGSGNVGPMAKSAIKELERKGIRGSEEFARFPAQLTTDDLEKADYIVALQHSEHLPLLEERHPAWVEKVEFWDVDDAPGIFGMIESEVMDLTSRLLCGGKQREPQPQDIRGEETVSKQEAVAPKSNGAVVKVGRETKGRRGKGVTTVFDVPVDAAGLQELASKLKQACGTGGTAKDGKIEIQGDQRERISSVLERMGYRVKRVGG